MRDLKQIVRDLIAEKGIRESSALFGVSTGTVSNWLNGKTPPTVDAVEKAIILTDDFSLDPPTWEKTELTTWMGKKVMMLLPVYRSFNADTHFTLFANYKEYGPEKIGMIIEKGTVIHEARNKLVDKALQTDAEYFIMSDDDMIYPCGNPAIFNGRYGANVPTASASFNAISRIMSHGADKQIVGALYFGRHSRGMAQCALGFDTPIENEKLRKFTHQGLVKTRWVGTGFLRVHRSVFEALKKEIDNGKFPECKPTKEGYRLGYFNPVRVGVGEDVSFCLRAGELGISTYVDTSLIALHVGDCAYGPHNTK